ncbi:MULTISPECIES: HIRAN domain-containing protein [unclassified Thioalkalivibrio]|uniref:HIRAN domain-containing protein n=1 Tax=unclassified Thioalkalivibrio TaxID=2621013 RepID=UPI000361A813|nr:MULTISPECIES: HIRAN domain-containing protein [unclassified Thioalkalivibrio]PYG03440.1 HIRAN domain-containing protein [Thioalkalivibrio sp. ALE21]
MQRNGSRFPDQARPVPVLRGYYARRDRIQNTATTEELLQRIPLAGYRHHEAPRLWPHLRRGQGLTVQRERLNPVDPNAVAVCWLDHQLGYLPRDENDMAAELLDRNEDLVARIIKKRDSEDPWERLELGVYRRRTPGK